MEDQMKKNKVQIIRLSEEEDGQLRQAAKLGETTVSDYIRSKIFPELVIEKCPKCGSDLIDTVVSRNRISAGDPVQENQYSTYCPKCYWSAGAEDDEYNDYLAGKTPDPRD
jgi:uncharacterized protein with PIN domain